MAASTSNIKGLSELQDFLDQLPGKIEANIMRGALRAGMTPMMKTAVQMCPVDTGHLRDSIRISTALKNHRVSAWVKVGGKWHGHNLWWTHIIEFTGARPHFIKAKTGEALAWGAGSVFHMVHHPGMKASPFMRPAFDSKALEGVTVAAEYIKKRLTKEGINTAADVTIELEDK